MTKAKSLDTQIGSKVKQALINAGIETPMKTPETTDVVGAFELILNAIGLSIDDDSTKETPTRIAKMYLQEIFYGMNYANFPKCTTIVNAMQADEMVLVKRILVRSVCEHHFVPFIGYANVAYIPGTKIMGLSKFNRIVDFFSRRPQVQERLTEQVSLALRTVLETEDVAVTIEAEHYCVKLRGVQDPHSSTVTSKLSGKFREVAELRAEFLTLCQIGK